MFVEVGGKPMVFESGLLAMQADGAVTCGVGENIVFSAVTSAKEAKEGVDFFPLQVEYREKFYAAGRFPGGYMKREARPSEKEILTMRVTDRPIRTLFPDGFYREVQINNMLLSCDGQLDTDILSVNASSAALTITELPFNGPIGAVRIARNDGAWIINPNHEQLAASDIDLTYCGSREKTMMIEGSSKEVSEADFIAAMKRAHEEVIKIIDGQLELRKALGLPEKVIVLPKRDTTFLDKARELIALEAMPGIPLEEFHITGVEFMSGTGLLELTWVSRPGETYAVDTSTNLVAWGELTDNVPSGGTRTTYSTTIALSEPATSATSLRVGS